MVDPTTTWAPARRRPAVEHLAVLAPGAGVDATGLPTGTPFGLLFGLLP